MDILWWIIIIILFLLSFIGIVMPIIPGLFMIWGGFLIYHFAIEPLTGLNFWITIIILSILTLLIDYIASSAFVKKYGGSKAGAWAAIAGIIIGPFIFGPIGVLIGPFIFVTITELIRGFPFKKAVKIGFASFVGFLGGGLVKAVLHITMIVIFLFKVI